MLMAEMFVDEILKGKICKFLVSQPGVHIENELEDTASIKTSGRLKQNSN